MKISIAKTCAAIAIVATVYGLIQQTAAGVYPDWPTAIGVIAVSIGLVFNREHHKAHAADEKK